MSRRVGECKWFGLVFPMMLCMLFDVFEETIA